MLPHLRMNTDIFVYLGMLTGTVVVLYYIAFYTIKTLGKNPKYLLPVHTARRLRIPLLCFFVSIALYTLTATTDYIDSPNLSYVLRKISVLLFILAIAWSIIVLVKTVRAKVVGRYDLHSNDNLRARKIYTQFSILERIITFIVVILAIGVALMSFKEIRQVGISMLTSAGIAGIIIGFAAQKALATLLAGIQIAFTQPIRLDDVVIVEGEWGVIEEINLTYVVVKIWDKRRLVVPTTYFIEKPFQNWTRNSSDILGTVFIYTDPNVPFDRIRKKLSEILVGTELWDGEVDVLQVTDMKRDAVELRALMSAKDSPTAWDLRVHVREQLIQFLQQDFPQSIPTHRVLMKNVEQTA